MPATAKNKRKIQVNGRNFYWTARNDISMDVTIVTSDKGFFAYYLFSSHYDTTFHGKIRIDNADIPELSHIQPGLWIDTPDWSEFDDFAQPSMIRRVIVHIFETLKYIKHNI